MRILATVLVVVLLAATTTHAQSSRDAWSFPDTSLRTEHDATSGLYATSALLTLAAVFVVIAGMVQGFCIDFGSGDACAAIRARREPFYDAAITVGVFAGVALGVAIALDVDSRSRRASARASRRHPG